MAEQELQWTEAGCTLDEWKADSLGCKVPDHTLGGLHRYVNHRLPPGDFLRAVLENNLTEALGRADDTNQRTIKEIVSFIYSCLPSNCWGSREKVEKWLAGEEA